MHTTHTRWRIEFFGGLRLIGPDRSVTRFRRQKTASLLAYLACHPDRPHLRDVLIELLWPESDPDAARHNLRESLSSLRHQL